MKTATMPIHEVSDTVCLEAPSSARAGAPLMSITIDLSSLGLQKLLHQVTKAGDRVDSHIETCQ